MAGIMKENQTRDYHDEHIDTAAFLSGTKHMVEWSVLDDQVVIFV